MAKGSVDEDPAVVYEAEEGGYWAKAPRLPGVYTQAETWEELEANLREAVELYLADGSEASVSADAEKGQVVEIAL